MIINYSDTPQINPIDIIKDMENRKPYKKPHLEVLDDLRTLTLGASPFPTESSGGGLPNTHDPLGS